MRIVEFHNGKFGVKSGWWIFASYLDDGGAGGMYRDVWWPVLFGYAARNSIVDSYAVAKSNLDNYIDRNNKKKMKVVKEYKL